MNLARVESVPHTLRGTLMRQLRYSTGLQGIGTS
jgi:hypothetical protein